MQAAATPRAMYPANRKGTVTRFGSRRPGVARLIGTNKEGDDSMSRRLVWYGGVLLLLACALIGGTYGAGAARPATSGAGPHGQLTATATPLAATPTPTACTI